MTPTGPKPLSLPSERNVDNEDHIHRSCRRINQIQAHPGALALRPAACLALEGDVMSTVARLPIERTVEPVTNDARNEFILSCCEGLPPARQKRLILQARSHEVGFIGDGDAEILIDALGLRSA